MSNNSRGDMFQCPNVLPSPPQRAGPCGFRISSAVIGAMPASRPRGCAPFRAADVSEHKWPIVLAHGCPAHMICMVARLGAHGFPDSGLAPQERGSLKLKLVTVGARRFLENCFFRALRCTQTTRGVNEIQIAETSFFAKHEFPTLGRKINNVQKTRTYK